MATNKLPKPEKGDTPKKIMTANPPGGPKTPGAKQSGIDELAAKARDENANGTSRSK